MLLTSLGLTVLNQVPPQAITGLLSGKLELAGGVVRWAAGTGKGGQIFMHLLPAGGNSLFNLVPGLNFLPGLVANFQLQNLSGKVSILGTKLDSLSTITQLNSYRLAQLSTQMTSLSAATHNVLQLAAGTALLSGLGLAVSSIGFLVVNKKLNAIDERLKDIQQDVKAIRDFLELKERSELRAALKDLLQVGEMKDATVRDRILHDRRLTLMALNEKYKELFAHAQTLGTIAVNEEYFALTGLAYTRCTAELGEYETAQKEMKELSTFWNMHARRIADEYLLGQYPERFLASDFAEDVPVSALVNWLDFVKGDKKGYEWIDDLRKNMNEPWYKKSWQKLTKGGGLNRSIGIGFEKERDVIIPTLQKLVARQNVFEGYVAQYDMLKTHQMTPSVLEQHIAQLPAEAAVEGHYILRPARKAA